MRTCGTGRRCGRLMMCCCLMSGIASVSVARAGGPGPTGGAGSRAGQWNAAGKATALTVLPVELAGKSSAQVGEVLATMLERAGMTDVGVNTTEFHPPEQGDLGDTAVALATFAKANPPPTDYVLFAQIIGSPAKGATEVRGIIVNRKGEVVWKDRQTGEDADFKRMKPNEPMTACLLVVQRLRGVLDLGDPTSTDAPEGKLMKRWEQKTGVPDESELKAMGERKAAFKSAPPTVTMVVYPVRAGGKSDAAGAIHLAKLLTDAGVARARAASDGPELEIKGDMNEQKMLWEMARGFRGYVQTKTTDADYVLFADYLMGNDPAGKAAVGGVHFALCDRKGEWVIVDYQNSHHDDFNAIKPKSAEDCDRLVLKRLEGYRN